jgi:hypothetical protein
VGKLRFLTLLSIVYLKMARPKKFSPRRTNTQLPRDGRAQLSKAMNPTVKVANKTRLARVLGGGQKFTYVTGRSFDHSLKLAEGNPDAAQKIADSYRSLEKKGVSHAYTGEMGPGVGVIKPVASPIQEAIDKIEAAGRRKKAA